MLLLNVFSGFLTWDGKTRSCRCSNTAESDAVRTRHGFFLTEKLYWEKKKKIFWTLNRENIYIREKFLTHNDIWRKKTV